MYFWNVAMVLFEIIRRMLLKLFRRLNAVAGNSLLFILHTATAAVVFCPKSEKSRLLFFLYIAHVFSHTEYNRKSKSFFKGNWEIIFKSFKSSVGIPKILISKPLTSNICFTAKAVHLDNGNMEHSDEEKTDSSNDNMQGEGSRTNTGEQVECLQMEGELECSVDEVSQPLDSSREPRTPLKRKTEERVEGETKRLRSLHEAQRDESTQKNMTGNLKDETSGSTGERVELSTDNVELPDEISQKAEIPDLVMGQTTKSPSNKSNDVKIADNNDKNTSAQAIQTTLKTYQSALLNNSTESDDHTPPDTKPPKSTKKLKMGRRKYNSRTFLSNITDASPANLEGTADLHLECIIRETKEFVSTDGFNSDFEFLQLQRGILASTTQLQPTNEYIPPGSAGTDDGNAFAIHENIVSSTTGKFFSQQEISAVLQDTAKRLEELKKNSERLGKESGHNIVRGKIFFENCSDESRQPTPTSEPSDEIFSNGKTFRELLQEFKEGNHEEGANSGDYYPKFRKYPGLADDPTKVKKDARFQKKFYKRKPIVLPTDWGKDNDASSTAQPEPSQLHSDQMNDEATIVGEYPPNHSKDENPNPPSPVEHERGRKLSYDYENDTPSSSHIPTFPKFGTFLAPGYKESSFEQESPTDSDPNSESSEVNDRQPLDDVPELLPSETSQLRDNKSDSLTMISTSQMWISPTKDEAAIIPGEKSMQKPSTSKRFKDEELRFACITFNDEEILDKEVIFCRDMFYEPPSGSSSISSIPLRSCIRIEYFKTFHESESVSLSWSVEEFLVVLSYTQREYLQWLYTDNRRSLKFSVIIPIFKIPMKSSCSIPDDDYELIGDTLMRAPTANRRDITLETCASEINMHQANARRSGNSSDSVIIYSDKDMECIDVERHNRRLKCIDVVGISPENKGSLKMDSEDNRISEVFTKNLSEVSPQEDKVSSKLQDVKQVSTQNETIFEKETKGESSGNFEASYSSTKSEIPQRATDSLVTTDLHLPSTSSCRSEKSVSSIFHEICKERENVCSMDTLEHYKQERNSPEFNKAAQAPKLVKRVGNNFDNSVFKISDDSMTNVNKDGPYSGAQESVSENMKEPDPITEDEQNVENKSSQSDASDTSIETIDADENMDLF